VVAITIPFDIRDMFQDKVYGLKTIATVFGEKKALLACQLMLFSYLVLLFLFRDNGFNNDFFALSTTIILSGWLIFKSKWEKNEYYYFLYLDGTLILQYLMLVVFQFVF
jgi:4-hydroxybenzoate polyprenyltransferase